MDPEIERHRRGMAMAERIREALEDAFEQEVRDHLREGRTAPVERLHDYLTGVTDHHEPRVRLLFELLADGTLDLSRELADVPELSTAQPVRGRYPPPPRRQACVSVPAASLTTPSPRRTAGAPMRAVLPTDHTHISDDTDDVDPTDHVDPADLVDPPEHTDCADDIPDLESGTEDGTDPEKPEYAEVVTSRDGVVRPTWADRSAAAREYFDTEWGCPVTDERGLFELVALLVFAGGLTWAGVLSKRGGLRAGLGGFDPDVVARFTDDDIAAALADASMIRNERKIRAVVANARAVVSLRETGGLVDLVWAEGGDETPTAAVDLRAVPRSDDRSAALAAALREAGFVHVGPVAAQALLLAAGVVQVERDQNLAWPGPDAEGIGAQDRC